MLAHDRQQNCAVKTWQLSYYPHLLQAHHLAAKRWSSPKRRPIIMVEKKTISGAHNADVRDKDTYA